ncbi:MAG: CotH kinase family protein [Ignavibacteriaceae bacterium]
MYSRICRQPFPFEIRNRNVTNKSGIRNQKSAVLIALFFVLFLTSCDTVTDNNPVNNLNTLTTLHLFASKEDLLNVYNNRFTNLEIPVKVDYEGNVYKGEMEPSGAGSRYFPKYSYEITLKEGEVKNLVEFNISAQVYDKVMVKSVLTKYMYEQGGFPVFYTEPVFITMNSENLGLYAFIEEVDEYYFAKYNIPVYEHYQVKFDAKFTFSRKNNVKENFDKEIPNDDNYENIEVLIAAIDEVSPEDIYTELNKLIDVEEYLKYHVITTIRHDPDAFNNNFFLYKETPMSPFRVIPWDFDKTFDIVGRVGFYGYNDIIRKLFLNDSCRAFYKEYMRYYLNTVFTEGRLYPIIDELAARISPYYQYDPYLGHNDFEKEVQSLKTFITERRKFLLGEVERFE